MAKEVLIVEDDRRLASACSRALEQEGYAVREVYDGVAAMDAVVQVPPALILLDLLLPKRDGRALLESLRSHPHTAQIPVLAMSGVFRGKSIARELEESGARAFLEKPFEPALLAAAVHKLIGDAEEPSEQVDWSRARLCDVSAAEFLWRAMDQGVSGLVHFKCERLHKVLALDRGTPVGIRSNAIAETLGRFLLRRRKIDKKTYDELCRSHDRQGETLLRMKAFTASELEELIRAQSAAKLLELFSWVEGEAWVKEGTGKLDHASRLVGWTPDRTLLRGVKYVPYERMMGVLTPFASFGVERTGRKLAAADARVPAVASLLQQVRDEVRVGDLLAEHAASLYGLWLLGALHFSLPAGDGPPSSPSLRSIPIPDAGRAGELQERLNLMRAQTYFQVLGVAPGADADAVQAAYRQLAKRYHPDRFSAEPMPVRAVVAEIFQLISTARETLADPTRHEEYVRRLQGGGDDKPSVNNVLEAEKLCREGEALLKKREYPTALGKFEEACKLDPEEGELHALRGWAHFVVHRQDPQGERVAIEALQRAVSLAPESTKGYYYLAQLHKACNRPDQARKFLRKVLSLDPEHHEAGQALRVLQMRKQEAKGSGGLFGFGRKKG